MATERKTTLEERLEIVSFALTHEKDYQKAANGLVFLTTKIVSSWVRKYELEGKEGLVELTVEQEKEIGRINVGSRANQEKPS